MSAKRRTPAPPRLSALNRTLRRDFGLRRLRPGQEKVMRSLMSGHDTLAIMPTGAGKSLCYQLPGLHLEGTTIIVSPLISLIKDQCDKLVELDQPAARLDSSLSASEEDEVLERFENQELEFLLVTPERLAQPEFRELASKVIIDVLVVDEVHCISQWGHDFRPTYLEIGAARKAVGNPPLLALTATANGQVIEDIKRHLGAEKLKVVDTGIYRENLELQVVPVSDDDERREHLARFLGDTEGSCIVYTSTIKQCEELTEYLQSIGFEVDAYHGRLGKAHRTEVQEKFMDGELRIVVATSAFGMGIDKPDIRAVVHYNIPGSLDAYYQEAGRAGRDGEPAVCRLYYLGQDRNTQIFFLSGACPNAADMETVLGILDDADDDGLTVKELAERTEKSQRAIRSVLTGLAEFEAVERLPKGGYRRTDERFGVEEIQAIADDFAERRAADRERLERMENYAQTALCRWHNLIEYFAVDDVTDDGCDHCDNCGKHVELPPPEPPRDLVHGIRVTPLDGDLRVGGKASVPVYGEGEVIAIGDDAITVAFGDGEQQRFARAG